MKIIDKFKYLYRGEKARRFGENEIRMLYSAAKIGKNNLAFDIGANMGEYLYSFRKCFLNVVAVEPIESCATYLKSVVNELKLEEAMILSSDGENAITIPYDERGSLVTAHASAVADFNTKVETKIVRTITLDTLIEKHGIPDLIKIDVEGAEYQILEGCRVYRKQLLDVIFIVEVEERHTGLPVSNFINLMEEIGHTAYTFDGQTLRPISNLLDNAIETSKIINYVFMKESTGNKLNGLAI